MSRIAKHTLRFRKFTLLPLLACIALAGCGKPSPDAAETLATANQLIDQGSVGQAIKLLDAFRAENPGDAAIVESLAFAHSRNRDHLMAAITFLDLANLRPDQPEYILFAAEALSMAEDWVGASDQYRRYLQARPQDTAAWIQLGNAEERQDRPALALDAFLKAYDLGKDSRLALRIARLYAAQNQTAQAKTWYLTVAATDKSLSAEALLGQLELEMANGRYSEADAIARRLNKEHPGMLELSPMAALLDQLTEWRTKEDAAETRRKAEEAEQRRKKAAEERAAAIAAINERAQATQQAGPTPISTAISADGTLTTTVRSAEVAPQLPPPPPPPPPAPEPLPLTFADQLALDAESAAVSGNYQQAVTLYRRSLAEDPSQVERWRALAIASLNANEPQLALAAILEARRRNPENTGILLDYFAITERALPPQAYFNELDAAYQEDSSNPDLILRLARAYNFLVHNRGSARILYNEFLRLAPDHPEAPFARAELADL